jgi:hypothetical protein
LDFFRFVLLIKPICFGKFSAFIRALLPDFIVSYYELLRVESVSDVLHLYLQEKNYEETNMTKKHLLSKGSLLPEITIQDFPIRDKRVFLHIKRRYWLNTHTGKVEQRNWNQVAQGTRKTGEFAAFLSDRRCERDSLIRRRMTSILLGVFTELMVKNYCVSIKIFKADFSNGIKSPMLNNGFFIRKIWAADRYFDNRSTNASTESFNAKIKAFRSQFRGVGNVEFLLY